MYLVIPIYKSGNQTLSNNYRPISVLTAVSKIYEKVVLHRLLTFFDNNNIIEPNQFGFTARSSTLAACLNLTNYLSKEQNLKKLCACVFLDIKRAFDTVHHSILIHKLGKLKFNSQQINLFQSYLLHRHQYVTVNGVESRMEVVTKGVPQGSIIGPILFNFFINDMFQLKLHGLLQLYADDGVLMYADSCLENLYVEMQEDLNTLNKWFNQNHLILNTEKTKYMIFKSSNHQVSDQPLLYGSDNISRVKLHTYLGLLIDEKLKWYEHINSIQKSITPYIFAIRRVKHFISKKQLLQIYYAYIHSRLVYLNPIWSGNSQLKLMELEILQKRVLKYPVNHKSIIRPVIRKIFYAFVD